MKFLSLTFCWSSIRFIENCAKHLRVYITKLSIALSSFREIPRLAASASSNSVKRTKVVNDNNLNSPFPDTGAIVDGWWS